MGQWVCFGDAKESPKSLQLYIVLYPFQTKKEIATWLILPVAYACLKD
jgi:hypothetical protein